MSRTRAYTLVLSESRDAAQVGGKASNLGRLMRAGFPVPGGFVVTTQAYRIAHAEDARELAALPAEIADEIRLAYRAMGAGPVAVRSSATAEDLADASMAGQYETFLNVTGEEELLAAVLKCWRSQNTPRIRAYLKEHHIDAAGVAMAVVVQRLVTAEVSGVLFTANPHQTRGAGTGGGGGPGREMLVEASWGLGESVVSGRVQPDVLRLEQETGRVLDAMISDKHVELIPGMHEERQVEESRRRQACLGERDIQRLWEFGRKAYAHFGAPQDIEWALSDDEIFLLQSRPITTLRDSDAQDELLRSMRAHLRQEAAAGRGPWVLHNLAETLPHPTPLTWSVIRRFMSGSGGFGAMYRQAGFSPAASVDQEGFLERIGGRIYMDARRAPEMFFADFPYAYDPEALARSPDASQAPPTVVRGSIAARLRAGRQLAQVQAKLQALAGDFDRQLRDTLFPNIDRYVSSGKQVDLRSMDTEGFIERWLACEDQVLGSMGPELLMPSLISGMALGELRTFLAESFWDEDAESLAQKISSGGDASQTLITDAELHEVGKGMRPLEAWLQRHGHRAPGEFDLATPRWREQPASVGEMAARLAAGENPLDRHRDHCAEVNQRVEWLRQRLSQRDRAELDQRIRVVQRYMAFREDGKDYLMLGYDLLRDLALEAGRRLDVGADVFFLKRDEMFQALRAGTVPQPLISQRKLEYRNESRLELPRMIDAAAIDGLGDPPPIPAQADGYKAFAISTGSVAGLVRIVTSPAEAGDLGRGYILVCPSTDPSWTPLFVNAAGLVLERGGALSHGAVVAREMGLPAVVLPDATRIFGEGEIIRVDGTHGWVGRGRVNSPPVTQSPDADDTHIASDLVPPPPGRKDRRAARIRNICGAFWTLYLLGFFLLPAKFLYQPTLTVLDAVLWPFVRTVGKPGTVGIIAAAIAVLTLLMQKFGTDNRRLLEAKRRAASLQRQAATLPADSPRRTAMMRVAGTVQLRTLSAAMLPIGILLGPLIMPFVWFGQRIDPAVWSPPAGSAVQIVAMVDSNFGQPVSIEVPKAVVVDEATPASRTLPPIRKTLERLLALYRQPKNDPSVPWELQFAPDLSRERTADDLQAYLAAGVPPQGLTWLIRPPEDFSGRFPVSITSPGQAPVSIYVVLGENDPPAARLADAPAGTPIRQVRVVYPPARVEPVFFRPLAGAAWLHLSWLWIYVLVYVPVLFLVRALLKVA